MTNLDTTTVQIILIIVGLMALSLIGVVVTRMSGQRTRARLSLPTKIVHRVPEGVAADPRPNPPWYMGPASYPQPPNTFVKSPAPEHNIIRVTDANAPSSRDALYAPIGDTQPVRITDYASVRYEDMFPPSATESLKLDDLMTSDPEDDLMTSDPEDDSGPKP